MKNARALLGASVGLLLVGIACGDDPLAPACSGPVSVRVSESFPPSISWIPDCSVERLAFVNPVPWEYGLYWTIAAGELRIESGVRYGRVPRGAVEEEPPTGVVPSGKSLNVVLESPRGTTVGTATWVAP